MARTVILRLNYELNELTHYQALLFQTTSQTSLLLESLYVFGTFLLFVFQAS